MTTVERPDLAAMAARLSRALIAMERPILAAHNVSMWAYVVLTALRETPMRTQSALAKTIGADKTRLIAVLDDLQARGHLEREPDPADRRVHVLALTDAGRRLHSAVQRDIRQAEGQLLSQLPTADRHAFLRTLRALDRTLSTVDIPVS